MKGRINGWGLSMLLLAEVCTISAQASEISTIQHDAPADKKTTTTNGIKKGTDAVWDRIEENEAEFLVVSTADKKGIIESQTGEQITPCIWDDIHIPRNGKVAIVRDGGWFQYVDLNTRKLSELKFAGAHEYAYSPASTTVIAMGGETSMLLALSGEVLIPPFAGKIHVVDLKSAGNVKKTQVKKGRYFAAASENQFTLYGGEQLKSLFTLENTQFVPLDGSSASYIRVRAGGKEGLVDLSGQFVLEPKYNRLEFWNDGYVLVESERGTGLWRDGEMLVEPHYHQQVDIESSTSDVYSVTSGGTVTYYFLKEDKGVSFRTGAEYLAGGYVLGQDVKTGMYGVIKVGGKEHGKVVIPFSYPHVEGPRYARMLVRADGKKGFIPDDRDLPMEEPQVWFDTAVPLNGRMFSIQDGQKTGLYSNWHGLVLEPEENRLIRYDDETGLIVVEEANGQILAYNSRGDLFDLHKEQRRETLTEFLELLYERENGAVLIERQTGQPIGRYDSIYYDEETGLVVGHDEGSEGADLYTNDGKLLTKEVKVPVWYISKGSPFAVQVKIGETVYAAGKRGDSDGLALFKLEGQQLARVTDFVYQKESQMPVRKLPDGHKLLVMQRGNGTSDLWGDGGDQGLLKLEGVTDYQTVSELNVVLLKKDEGWDIYSSRLERLTQANYRSLQVESIRDERVSVILYRDRNTGLYGLLGANLQPLTPPLYTSIQRYEGTLPSSGKMPSFVFTTNQHFGYLDAQGNELFRTER